MTVTELHRPLPTQYRVEHGRVEYQGACTCGWFSRWYGTVELARMPLGVHVRSAR